MATSFDIPILSSIIAYSLCSGSLLLVNKMVLAMIPSSPLVTAAQCLFCVVAIALCHIFLKAPKLDAMTAPVLKAYGLYAILFVLAIYSNMRSLEASNVDTVIVFRSTVPLIVSLGDYLFMGREVPSARSLASMVVVLVGCAAFVAVDADFKMKGIAAYGWVSLYVLLIAAEMLWGKQITSSLNVSLGTSVLLNNAMGFFPFIFLGLATGEISKGLNADLYTPSANALLIFSCALSAGIGFSAWWCRSLVSATSFTVIGTVNKILTVFLNIIIWDKHASVTGTFFLLLCLAGGAFYQQAPLRSQAYQKVAAESDKLGEVGGKDSTPTIGGKASNGAVLSLQQTSK
jgi:hypothetical protein